MRKLTVIRTDNNTQLVKDVHGKMYILPVGITDVRLGVPFCFPWHLYTDENVSNFLIENNIFTVEDLYQNPKLASTLKGLGVDYYKLLATINRRNK